MMTQRTALISGASIAGLSTAYWLERTGWSVTVIERAERFREGARTSTCAAAPVKSSTSWG
ncbi:FAD-dependent oxidoreductase [Arenivirga flava]|uniref:FAD dependent oxidoreductase domain-containing protein n=1 Tax=Arenivirga flava TaxID=1930060 RepID=A0AA37UHE4_9MICO|nr:hypothetical protein GCM10025874_21360 [Arenivirga flava]